MRKLILIIILIVALCGCSRHTNHTAYVDPFIGTGGHGHTYPGAALPFGMVQLGPDTRLTGWDGCSGYHYSDNTVYGFSHTHLSGTGVSDYGDILFMPFTGKVKFSEYASTFTHEKETASPGYYSVQLENYKIKAELTVTPRTGVHRCTFPRGETANILIDLTHRDTVIDSGIAVVGDNEIEGFRRSTAWAEDQRVYFTARFSKPFASHTIAVDDEPVEGKKEAKGKNVKAVVTFQTEGDRTIVVKVGISAVSVEGARKNLESETANKNFAQIKKEAGEQWNRALNKIKVTGGTVQQKRIFYTALYHALLNPNLFMDVDGKYRGRDLEIHQAKDFEYYSVFSLWDTFRAAHPLFTIIEPRRTNDFIKTFIAQYEQGGLLPVWELAANETFCMIGYHAVSVIADAYTKGLRDYDVEKAYEAMRHSALRDHFGLKFYKQMGYIPAEEEAESVSKTLEYAYDDWCIAQTANALGKEDDYKHYLRRAQFYKNLYDPSTGFMRAKMLGTWFSPFYPAEVNFNYTEANAWQYSFYVPHDISGLIALMGGNERFVRHLDQLFGEDSSTSGRKQADITGLIGQYAHGNEPSHHMAYLYNYAGRPWKTQQRVREIMDKLYTDRPDGLCGNEDCGQMSAWYVLSAMGFYPVTPGSGIYAVGTPIFPETVIDVGNGRNGRTFSIIAENVSAKNIYIQSASLGDKPYKKSWLRHEDIMKGGRLVFRMGPEPGKTWGVGDGNQPESVIDSELILPVPYVASGSRMFSKSTQVALAAAAPGTDIYYALDGSIPTAYASQSTLYKSPVTITKSAVLRAVAVKEGMPESFVMEARFDKIPGGRDIHLATAYASQYSAGGDMALIDGIRGGKDFRTGTWQGYHGVDMEAVVDLGKQKTIRRIAAGFLQDNNAWIFMPLRVEYSLSKDGKRFSVAAVVPNVLPHRQGGSIVKDFSADIYPARARYVKIHARNTGVCPPWHKGAGEKAWIFVDEIVIE
ncbi:MAG: glycoside hydrolase family 92 protein [bacterium]|nr:glycoside hydrolase family 92 protein [bacterium]